MSLLARHLTCLTLLLSLASWGCSSRGESKAAPSYGFEVANVAPAKIEEVLRDGDVVFLKLREAQWSFWARVPAARAKGASVGGFALLGKGAELASFKSEALGKTFKSLLMIDDVQLVTEAEAQAAIRIAPIEGGQTIGQLFAQRKALAGKPIKARARVVKANKGIFETNWYHLRDGTGGEGTNDLTVTSKQDVQVGDVVVVEGALTVDHSLGFGYDYDAIVLDGTLKVGDAAAPVAATPDAKTTPQIDWVARAREARAKLPEVTREAPTREVWGLTLGDSDEAALKSWLEARGLKWCGAAASRSRKAQRHDCRGELLTNAALPEVASTGRLTQLLLTRSDGHPLSYLTTTHTHSLPGPAADEYTARVKALTARLGEPTLTQAPNLETIARARITRVRTMWRFKGVEVSLSLVKLSDKLRLTEVWNMPSDQARIEQRPGVKGAHGALKSSPNPHKR